MTVTGREFNAAVTYDKSLGGDDDHPEDIVSMISVVCDCGYESTHKTHTAAMRVGEQHIGDHALARNGFTSGTGILDYPFGW
jgi:hypothetical protein